MSESLVAFFTPIQVFKVYYTFQPAVMDGSLKCYFLIYDKVKKGKNTEIPREHLLRRLWSMDWATVLLVPLTEAISVHTKYILLANKGD